MELEESLERHYRAFETARKYGEDDEVYVSRVIATKDAIDSLRHPPKPALTDITIEPAAE